MADNTSVVPLILGVGAVVSLVSMWQIIRLSRLVGRSSVVLPSRLGEVLVDVRCAAWIRGARGEGSIATSPFVTLLVTRDRLVLRTAVGDWDFPKESSDVYLAGPTWARLGLRARNGPLDARIYLSEDGLRSAVDKMRSAGWTIADTAHRPVQQGDHPDDVHRTEA